MGKRELVLLEEQTLLSRERTMQQYITTGAALIGLGLLAMKFFEGPYTYLGIILIAIGFAQMYLAYVRFSKYRKIVRKIRKKEKKLRLEVGE